jgi:hypothetical protein
MRDKIKQVNELVRKDGVYIKDVDKDKKNPPLTVSAWSKIKYFRQVFGDELGFDTQLFVHDNHYVAKCKILAYDPERVLATGHHKTFKNQGDHQACETLAISRALSFFGILESDITSLEEYNMLGIPVTKRTKGAANGSTNKGVDQIINEFKKCRNIYEYRQVKKYNDPYIEQALTKHPSTYKAIMNVVENVEDKLNKQEKI